MQFDVLAFKRNPEQFFLKNDFGVITLRCVIDILFDAKCDFNFNKDTIYFCSFMHYVLCSRKLSKQTSDIKYLFTKGFNLHQNNKFDYKIVIRHASIFKKEHDYTNLETFCKNGFMKFECDTKCSYGSVCIFIFNPFHNFYEYAPDTRVFRILLRYDTNEIIKKSLENDEYVRTKLETEYLSIYHMIFLKIQIQIFKKLKFLLEEQVLSYLV